MPSSTGVFGPFPGEFCVDRRQGADLVEIEGCEAVLLRGAEVAAGALDPEHLDVLAGQRVLFQDLRGRVASAGVRERQVVAQPVGPVDERARTD